MDDAGSGIDDPGGGDIDDLGSLDNLPLRLPRTCLSLFFDDRIFFDVPLGPSAGVWQLGGRRGLWTTALLGHFALRAPSAACGGWTWVMVGCDAWLSLWGAVSWVWLRVELSWSFLFDFH